MTEATKQETIVQPLMYAMSNFAKYNLWANKTMADWLRSKEESLLQQEIVSSFNSIRATVLHIYNTQLYWTSVIKGTEFIPSEFTGSTVELLDELTERSAELADYIQAITEQQITETRKIVNPWFECNLPIFEYLLQVVNHTTYHRGQVVTIGRQVGITDAPMTDYNYYNIYCR